MFGLEKNGLYSKVWNADETLIRLIEWLYIISFIHEWEN